MSRPQPPPPIRPSIVAPPRRSRPRAVLTAGAILLALLALGEAGSLSACSVFDSALYQNAGAGGASGQSWDAIEDACPYPSEKIISSDQRNNAGTVHLNDLADDVETCGKLTGVDGPDGVVGIHLSAGEVVHLEAKLVVAEGQQEPPIDLAVYMMDDCNPTACLKRVDRCPAGHEEELAWSVDSPGDYFFGFDSRAYDQSKYDPVVEISANFPLCGNNTLDEGEACDDGNKTDGDGCTSTCRAELKPGGLPHVPEAEPNNYYLTANELLVSAGETMTVQGDIGGSCDLDFFLIDVPEGGFVRATLLDKNGQPCATGSPTISLEFDDPTGKVELGNGVTQGGNACPSFDETTFAGVSSLPAGMYTIEMKPPNQGEGMDAFDYRLQVEVIGGGAGGAGGGM